MNWYYAQADQRQGPITDSQLDELLAAGTINENTLVWREGLADWVPLKDARAMGSGGTGPAPGVSIPAGWIRCTATGRYFPPEEIVYIDGNPYSAAAKPGVLQGVMQGGVLPTGSSGERTGPPWEHRAELGLFTAAWQTFKGVLFDAAQTFEKMKREGGLGTPLLYNVILGTIGTTSGLIYQFLFNAAGTRAFLPPGLQHASGSETSLLIGFIIGALIAMPIFIVLGSFMGAGFLHLSLMICSGAKQPFETTYRTYCYVSGSANILQVVPICGGMVSGIWALVCMCIGISRTHEISVGRAVCAVLLPAAVCCIAIVFILFSVFGAIAATQGIHH